MAGKRRLKKVFIPLAVLVVVGAMILSAVLGFVDFLAGRENAHPYTLPEVVATVNSEQLTKTELQVQLQRIRPFYEMQGVDLKEEETLRHICWQILEEMIHEELLLQEAGEKGIEAYESEVQAEYERHLAEFGDEDALREQLAVQDMTLEDFKEELARRLTVQKFIDSHMESYLTEGELELSEEKLWELYEEYSALREEEELPDFDEMRPHLEEELRQRKMGRVVGDLLEQLMEDSEVEVFL